MKLSLIDGSDPSVITTESFLGYMHRLKIGNGYAYDEKNISSDSYPLLAPRKKRGTLSTLASPQGIIAKDALGYVANGTLYYNGLATGLTGLSTGEKQLVSMGAYVCIFPDGKYYNTSDGTDYGDMGADWSSTGTVTYSLCTSDGGSMGTPTASATEPAEPEDGAYWIDTSATPRTLKKYSEDTGEWTTIPTVYTKISFTSQGQLPEKFKVNDGVTISGASFDAANGEKLLYGVGGETGTTADYIIIVGLLNNYTTQSTAVRIQRKIPAMDYVCECQNRLWGCFYGNDGEINLNEIYCCALGDFRNWRQYAGISTDSWAASVGSDGVWTGAVNYLGFPTFFKENRVHIVTVSATGSHKISEITCRGVQRGSSKSLVVVNETLYYKSRTDICAYQGAFPTTVSDALGDEKYTDAVSGAYGGKYYISMKDKSGKWHMFVYDISLGMWHREDELHAMAFAQVDDELYCIDAATGKLLALQGTTGTLEDSVEWCWDSGIMYYETRDKKYLSRYNIRLKMEQGATVSLYLEYDSSGKWQKAGTVKVKTLNTATLPIMPRRCDHMRLRLEGSGKCEVFAIYRLFEQGSDAR